jgi:IS5 family transposase
MYGRADKPQQSFLDFNQPIGLHINPDNRWVKVAGLIPWDVFEENYAGLFPSHTENVAKPLQMELGELIIQAGFRYSDRELAEQIKETRICSTSSTFPATMRRHRLTQVPLLTSANA